MLVVPREADMGMFVNVRRKLWGVGVGSIAGHHIGMVVHKEPLDAHSGVCVCTVMSWLGSRL
jgi:hypothetical protein